MVSTRQCSTKFSVGETVLCYEPDASKAKVLYESKILEVDFTKDEKGRKVPEYFVHFSGWNKSSPGDLHKPCRELFSVTTFTSSTAETWDRWVLEDQVLEGSEANRLRMKRLHEEAINRLKNKKKRKNYMSNQDTSQSSSEALCATPPQQPIPPTPSSPTVPCIEIEIPSALKLKLEDDCYFIKRKKKLVRLPRSPNVLEILKEYIDHIILQEEQDAPETHSSVKIVKEVMDGLRIYFDFTLSSLLLYNFERDQYDQVMESSATKTTTETTQDVKEQSSEHPVTEAAEENTECTSDEVKQEKNDSTRGRKVAPTTETSAENSKQGNKSSDRVLRRRSKRQKVSAVGTGGPTLNSSTVSSSGGERDDFFNVSCDLNEETNQKGVKRKLSEIVSDEDRFCEKPAVEEPKTDVSTGLSATNESSSFVRTTPSQVYGVEHLLRLFVKLPSLLAKTTIQENRLSLLLHHLTGFLKYLSSRANVLFSEDAYEDVIL